MDEMYLIIIVALVLIIFIALVARAYQTISQKESMKKPTPSSGSGTPEAGQQAGSMSPGKNEQIKTPIFHPEAINNPPLTSPEKKSTSRTKEKVYPEIDLTNDSLSIIESLNRLCQKFSIETCTLASTDGLVVASSFAGGTRDAAYFSNLYLREKTTHQGDITIAPLKYKNHDLIFIIRSQRNLNSEEIEAIKSDEKRILSFWL